MPVTFLAKIILMDMMYNSYRFEVVLLVNDGQGGSMMFKVLIVDKTNTAREEIKGLNIWGNVTGFVAAYEAKSAREALEKLQNNPVDLVLAEMELPEMSGIELLKEIMKKGLCRCVVLMNRCQDLICIRQALTAGAFDYISKPVNDGELVKVLLRAGNYILSIHEHEEKVRMLEERLDEKLETFFPTVDVKKIVNLIKSGASGTIEAAGRLFDTMAVILNYDSIKLETILKRALSEIVSQVSLSCIWLDKFISIDELKAPDFYPCKNVESLKAVFMETIKKVILIMKVLQQEKRDISIVNQIYDYVLTNVDSEISLKTVSDMLYMNRTYVSEVFKQKTGMSFIEYVSIVKVERAKKLLKDGNMKIYEIGSLLGFNDIEYFSRLFKKYTGFSLKQFRKEFIQAAAQKDA